MTHRAAIAAVTRVSGDQHRTDQDLVAVEAPLAIELRQPARPSFARSLGVVMRTPGEDEELAIGLLHGEGVIRRPEDVLAVRHARADAGAAGDPGAAVLEIDLAPSVEVDGLAGRALPSTSACGLCGRLEIQSLAALAGAGTLSAVTFRRELIAQLPDALRAGQNVFAETGGLHAAGLFASDGRCLVSREDVGRHNAVDKVVGWALRAERLPARDLVLAVSGRVAFEIVQKAALAGVAAIVAVGAPSSLAVEAARAVRIMLVGFTRGGRFNVYTGVERLER
jgi:FdhD protein